MLLTSSCTVPYARENTCARARSTAGARAGRCARPGEQPPIPGRPGSCAPFLHLESSTVCDDWPPPGHELVQAAGRLDDIRPRVQQQVVCVAEEQLQPGCKERAGRPHVRPVRRRRQPGSARLRAPGSRAPASAAAESTALRAALVPTATKPGVSMTPCGVWILPTRAAERDDLRERHGKFRPSGGRRSGARRQGMACS